jgi:tetratricopeptide (TPR) repeat protein
VSAQRKAARSLHRDVEAVWERLRAEFVLHEGFWLAVLFGAQAPDVAELVARTRDLARRHVKHVTTLTLTTRADEAAVLSQLLTPHPAGLAATWVLDDEASTADRMRLWSRLLRRLNERRDPLVAAHPAALVLACPASSLPLVRDTAPDLWSIRSLTATLDTATLDTAAKTTATAPTTPTAASPVRSELTPVPGKPIQPSPEVGALLKRAASALQSARTDLAVDASLGALDAASSPDDELLAHAWLAQVRAGQDEPAEAARHARIALEGRRPLELDTTVALLDILSSSLDHEIALDAATALVELHRELVRRSPDSPTTLRDLSVSLDKVAGIQQERGQLDDALTAYTESLTLSRRILTTYGETPQSLRDLSISLNKVAGIQQERGQLDDALTAYTESLTLRRRILTTYGETPQSLRDLTVSLDNVASIQKERGQLDDALTAYTESLNCAAASSPPTAKPPNPSATSPSPWTTSRASKKNAANSTTP